MTYIANPVAQAHAAAHRTSLLIERCRQAAPSVNDQILWYAYQQTLFLAWLDGGGFAQGEPEKENSGTEPLFSVPQRDSNEESQFTLSRINDAVE
jgi:hypothetical protein